MRYAWLCHPASVVAVIVLLLNDHLLKQAWPGFVTGKLSDVAGLVVAPPLLALLLLRRADLFATVLTGVLFTLMKTTAAGAEIASQAWSALAGPSRVLADPTDLIALPALALAWWIRRRTLSGSSTRLRLLVTMPLAVLAVTATSGAPEPHGPQVAYSVRVDESRIVVDTSRWPDERPDGMLASEDGGVTWHEWTGETSRKAQSAACVPREPHRCYRVVADRLGVEESRDGGTTWRTSWKLSEGRNDWAAREYVETGKLRSRSVAVQERPGGHVVVVANGIGGILVRDVGGTWQRLGWPGTDVNDDHRVTNRLDQETDVAFSLAAALLLGCIGAGLRGYQVLYTCSALLASGGLYLMLTGVGAPGEFFGIDVVSVFVGGPMLLVGGLTCLLLACFNEPPRGAVLTGVGLAPVLWLALYLPFQGWSMGLPDSHAGATVLAAALGCGVTGLAGVLVRRSLRARALHR
ncbi:hypothetical protein HII36_37475 [Nonomuraea sp. NN258]|uniref:hypothetical protein n=1 Tax=Nonomuraea antri TaxID=2730852 RepID=UPI0015697DCD|nr:hypothetical protein [Nonomuraea antri]NRQ37483.1 hypothetical protein [Nonomuraea antri]